MTKEAIHVCAFDEAKEIKDEETDKTKEAHFRRRHFHFTLDFSDKLNEEDRLAVRGAIENVISHKADHVLFTSAGDKASKLHKELFEKHMKAKPKTHEVVPDKKSPGKGFISGSHLDAEYMKGLISREELEACCILEDVADDLGKKKKKSPIQIAPLITVEETIYDRDFKKKPPPKNEYHVVKVKL